MLQETPCQYIDPNPLDQNFWGWVGELQKRPDPQKEIHDLIDNSWKKMVEQLQEDIDREIIERLTERLLNAYLPPTK